MVLAFPIIGNHLAWKVGDAFLVMLGADAVMGCGNFIFLPAFLIWHLRGRGLFTLNQLADEEGSDIWQQGWLSADQLEPADEYVEVWSNFISELRNGHVRLKEAHDDIISNKNKTAGYYSAKLVYTVLLYSDDQERCW